MYDMKVPIMLTIDDKSVRKTGLSTAEFLDNVLTAIFNYCDSIDPEDLDVGYNPEFITYGERN